MVYATLTQKITFFLQRQHLRDRGRVENWIHCNVYSTSGNFTLTSKFIWRFTSKSSSSQAAHGNRFCGVKCICIIHKHFQGGNQHYQISIWGCHRLVPNTWRLPRINASAHRPLNAVASPSRPCYAMQWKKAHEQRRVEIETSSNQQPTSSNICYVHNTRARVKTTVPICGNGTHVNRLATKLIKTTTRKWPPHTAKVEANLLVVWSHRYYAVHKLPSVFFINMRSIARSIIIITPSSGDIIHINKLSVCCCWFLLSINTNIERSQTQPVRNRILGTNERDSQAKRERTKKKNRKSLGQNELNFKPRAFINYTL